MQLWNCIGLNYWENEEARTGDKEAPLNYDEGWGEDENEEWEADGFTIADILELDIAGEDED